MSRQLVGQSTIIFGGRLFGAGVVFAVQALLARYWGADYLGEFLVITATCNLITVGMPLGFQTIGSYFAAEYRARHERRQLGLFLINAYGYVLATTALLLIAGPSILNWLGQADSILSVHFVPVVLLAFSGAMVMVSGSMLVGLKRPFAGFFADGVFRPIILVAALVAALGVTIRADGFTQFLWTSAIGYVAIALVQFVIVLLALRSVSNQDGELRPHDSRRWWRFALPWVLISLASDFFFDIDLLLLSQILSREELAIFGVAIRMFSLVSFGVAAVYAVSLPDMFESDAKSDRLAFNRKVGAANMVATGLSIVLLIGTAIFSPFVLQVFGPEFTAGALPLSILCLALVVRSAMGPATLVLSMHDRPYASLPAVAISVVVLVAGNWLLASRFGLMGAAIAAAIAIAVWSVGLWFTAHKLAKVDVSIMQWFRTRNAVTAGYGASQ